jgi:hypothetical protein
MSRSAVAPADHQECQRMMEYPRLMRLCILGFSALTTVVMVFGLVSAQRAQLKAGEEQRTEAPAAPAD